MNRHIYLGIMLCLLLQACSIGQSKSFCEKEGCDYKKAGICTNAFDIYSDRYGTIAEAYKDTPCKR